jgi:hypothetical protein
VDESTPLTRRAAIGTTAAGLASLAVLGLTATEAQADRPPDRYLQLQKAWDALMEARKVLKNAMPIFGGHRDKAVEHVDAALVELDRAVVFADKNK